MTRLLEVKNLKTYFRFGASSVKAVDGVSFHLDEGETLAIVGESGSGKSITATSILRLIPSPPGEIVDGEILFEGKDLLKASRKEIREVRGNKISMIFQEPMTSLNPVLTVGSQVAEPALEHDRLLVGKARDLAVGLLKKVRIAEAENRVDAYPHQFSGGMRQRVMIAMGMSCQPKLIIADEPTTALDVTVQAQLLDLLKDLTRNKVTSLILITHDLGVVARYADRINVMYAGRIVEHGTSEEVLLRPHHPYTLGLLKSIPRLDAGADERLEPIPGHPPDLANPPSGCPFHPRCAHAVARCSQDRPELEEISPGHAKACWVDLDDMERQADVA